MGKGQGQHENQALGISQEHVYTETRKQQPSTTGNIKECTPAATGK